MPLNNFCTFSDARISIVLFDRKSRTTSPFCDVCSYEEYTTLADLFDGMYEILSVHITHDCVRVCIISRLS